MFFTKSDIDTGSSASPSAASHAQRAAQMAGSAAQSAAQAAAVAAQNAGSYAQNAASGVSKNVQGRVIIARGWAAPQLEGAADYWTESLAPRISAALRSTAEQVRPPAPDPPRRRYFAMLAWPMLAAAVLAGLGAAAAIIMKARDQAAMSGNTESEVTAADAMGPGQVPQPASAGDPMKQDSSASTTPANSQDAVNGKVSSPGW